MIEMAHRLCVLSGADTGFLPGEGAPVTVWCLHAIE